MHYPLTPTQLEHQPDRRHIVRVYALPGSCEAQCRQCPATCQAEGSLSGQTAARVHDWAQAHAWEHLQEASA